MRNPLQRAELDAWDYDKNVENPVEFGSLGSKVRYWWKCSEFEHSWLATVHNKAKGSGCAVCANHQLWAGHNDIASRYPQLVPEFHSSNGVSPSAVLAGTQKWVWVCVSARSTASGTSLSVRRASRSM